MYSKIAHSDPKGIPLKRLHVTMADAPGLACKVAATCQNSEMTQCGMPFGHSGCALLALSDLVHFFLSSTNA